MSVYEFGPFQLDAERLLLCDRSEPVALGPKVVETLLALIEHPGEVLTKSTLLDRIWPEGYVDEANLAQNVYVLRKALRSRWNQETIETIPRRGYRFTAGVTRHDDVPLAEPPVVVVTAKHRTPWWKPAIAMAAAVALVAGLAFTLIAPRNVAARTALSPDGARFYEIGRYYWNLRTKDGITKSLAYFTHVIDTDPHNPRGYAALASANAIMGDYEFGPSTPKVYFARATAYAKKALAIDPNSGEAYAVLGMVSSETYYKQSSETMAAAFNDLQRAITLDPASGPAHEWYGIALLQRGRFNDAFSELRLAAELDPLSVATTAWLSEAAYHERRYDDAIAYARQTLDLAPQRGEVYEAMGLAYEARGDRARALDAFKRLAEMCTKCRPQAAALMAEVYARGNQVTQARAQLAIALASAQSHPKEVSPDDLAVALAAMGERGVALSWLRRSKGDFLKAEIASDPRFAVLRSDPGVTQIANQSG